jgi:two-component system NtrC family sensor kinase
VRRSRIGTPVETADRIDGERRTLVARLVAGAVHELNNPLSVVMGQATLLARGLGEESPLKARTDRISDAAQQCARVVRSLSDVIAPAGLPRAIPVNEALRETLALLGPGLRARSIEVVFSPGEVLPAWAEEGAFREFLAHLILAAEAGLEGAPAPRRIQIETGPSPDPRRLKLKVERSVGPSRESGKPSPEARGLAVSQDFASAIGASLAIYTPGRTVAALALIKTAGPPPPPVPAVEKDVVVLSKDEGFGRFLVEVVTGAGHRASRPQTFPSSLPEADAVVLDGDLGARVLAPWLGGPAQRRLLVLVGGALPLRMTHLLQESGVAILRKPVEPEALLDALARLGH